MPFSTACFHFIKFRKKSYANGYKIIDINTDAIKIIIFILYSLVEAMYLCCIASASFVFPCKYVFANGRFFRIDSSLIELDISSWSIAAIRMFVLWQQQQPNEE